MFALAAPIWLVTKVRRVTALRAVFSRLRAGGNPRTAWHLAAVANFCHRGRTEYPVRQGSGIRNAARRLASTRMVHAASAMLVRLDVGWDRAPAGTRLLLCRLRLR